MQDKNEVFWDAESYTDIEVPPINDDEAQTIAGVMDIMLADEEASLVAAPKYDPIIVGMEPSSLVGRIARNSTYGSTQRLGEMSVISAQTDVGKSVIVDGYRTPQFLLDYKTSHNMYPETFWRPEDILNTNGPRGSSRKSDAHAKKKRKTQNKSRRINRSK